MNRRLTRTLALPLAAAAALVSLSAASAEAHPRTSRIQGVVADQSGHYVDDVLVEAFDSDGDIVASAFTYASDREYGPQHGYFVLEVPAGHDYTVALSKRGYVAVDLQRVDVSRNRPTSLGQLELDKRLIPTEVTAAPDDQVVTPAERVRLHINVVPDRSAKPTGTVVVKEGRATLGRATLRPGSQGRVTVDLGKLSRGTHALRVLYSGSDLLKASDSRLALTVARPGRRHDRLVLRPNVW